MGLFLPIEFSRIAQHVLFQVKSLSFLIHYVVTEFKVAPHVKCLGPISMLFEALASIRNEYLVYGLKKSISISSQCTLSIVTYLRRYFQIFSGSLSSKYGGLDSTLCHGEDRSDGNQMEAGRGSLLSELDGHGL